MCVCVHVRVWGCPPGVGEYCPQLLVLLCEVSSYLMCVRVRV